MNSLETRLKESTQKLHETLKRNEEMAEKLIKYKTEAESYKWAAKPEDKADEYRVKY